MRDRLGSALLKNLGLSQNFCFSARTAAIVWLCLCMNAAQSGNHSTTRGGRNGRKSHATKTAGATAGGNHPHHEDGKGAQQPQTTLNYCYNYGRNGRRTPHYNGGWGGDTAATATGRHTTTAVAAGTGFQRGSEGTHGGGGAAERGRSRCLAQ